MHFISAALFAMSANLDNFTIGIVCGINKIRINLIDNLVIAAFSCVGTFFSMSIGRVLGGFISERAANLIGSSLLILIGLWLLYAFFREMRKSRNRTEERMVDLTETVADCECASLRRISRREVLTLAFALAVNNMALGVGGSITGLSPYITSVCTFFLSIALIAGGQSFGRAWLSAALGKYASLLSAGMILALGLYEIFI